MKRIINYKNLAQSTAAILTGFGLVFVLLLIIGINPAKVMGVIFTAPFQGAGAIASLFTLIVAIGAASLASAIGFKGKMFNIGIPGQMLISANAATYIILVFFPQGLFMGWLIVAIIGAIVGGLVGWLVGFLKTRFNINEVLSTIMMNWMFFHFGKYIYINTSLSDLKIFGSKAWPESFKMPIIFGFAILIGLVLLVWFIFAKTTLGYKIEMVGANEDAAHYAGIKTKKIQKLVMTISGALAGFCGIIFYGSYIGNYRVPLADALDNVGFLGITVGLLAFRNPFAIFVLSIFFAILNVGGIIAAAVVQISLIIMALLTGFIFYAFACYISDQHNLFKRFENLNKEEE